MKLFCFGFGYTAQHLVARLSAREIDFAGTRASVRGRAQTGVAGRLVDIAEFGGERSSELARELLCGATHILVSIPPDLEGDPVLRNHREDIAALANLDWIGYLSTVGVYGEHQGAWVDETTPARPKTERSWRRLAAEEAWLEFARQSGHRVEIFRLPGIYGPGRNVIDSLKAGTVRRIIKPDQIFNRIHIDDVVQVLVAAMAKAAGHVIYNVCDDKPAPPQDVIAFAAELVGLPLPDAIPIEKADLGHMAASFYSENKRVCNARVKSALQIELLFPTYREGLTALATVS
jgi:nucleoside-diphosphate-sugar epimerase